MIVASLYFYSYGSYKNLYIILISIVGNFLFYKIIISNYSKVYFVLGITFNIGILGYFKYANFIFNNLNNFFNINIGILKIVLPLGISFYTFQQIGFLVDVYRNKSIQYSFLEYCSFITFFPEVVSGPIVSHDELIPQLQKNRKFNFENFCKGLFIFSIGLGKKVLLADYLSKKVALGFDTLESLTFIQGWISSISFTMQLFLDFSGYSDMAIGLGLMFNLELPLNFMNPYNSKSIKEFWNRWHITLNRFLIKYVYIPLGGSKKGKMKTYINIFIVFIVSGIWHGAAWTFVLWGTLHGIASVINRFWTNNNLKMNKFIGWFLTFNFVNIAWVFFRAKSFKDAFKVIKAMLSVNTLGSIQNIAQFGGKPFLILLFGIVILVLITKPPNEISEKCTKNLSYAFCGGIIAAIAILCLNNVSEFIYFNF
jgi:D-alanyl-lipoteichoic acid acyltransferase DltB (MBOAT superfamily)